MAVNEFKSFFKTVGAGEGSSCYYPTRLDTYRRGCQHNCSYCWSVGVSEGPGMEEQSCAMSSMFRTRGSLKESRVTVVSENYGIQQAGGPVDVLNLLA